MFKLAKIEGSGTNQPSPVRLKTREGVEYVSGGAYRLADGELANIDETMLPTHIVIENLKPDSADTVLCYRVQDNMIFEVPTYANPSNYFAGIRYAIATSSVGAGIGIGKNNANGVIMVDDVNGAKKIGDTIYVRITTEENY